MTFRSPPPSGPASSLDSLHDPAHHEVPALRTLNAGLAEVQIRGPDVKYSVESDQDDDDDDDGDYNFVSVGIRDTARSREVREAERLVGAIISHSER